MIARKKTIGIGLGLALSCVVASMTLAERARADVPAPAAPGLALTAAHAAATDAFKTVLAKVPAAAAQKIPGAYVAFAPDAAAPFALAACDDDGDYVIVLSDAMLALADAVAHAKATDDALATNKLDAYARLLAKAQRPGERLLTPPAGFYDASQQTAEIGRAQNKAFRAILAYLTATELAHVTAGDLVCAHPTATHERGDDEWTAAEQAAALAASRIVHEPRHVATADARGSELASEAGQPDDAYVALLTPLLAGVEATPDGRASVPYVELHPNQAVRVQIVRTATLRAHKAASPVRPAPAAR